MSEALDLLRCSRCGLTIYGPPNGAKEGERCNAAVIGEWDRWAGILMTRCLGTFQSMGKLVAAVDLR
jgi:hypothetical protein